MGCSQAVVNAGSFACRARSSPLAQDLTKDLAKDFAHDLAQEHVATNTAPAGTSDKRSSCKNAGLQEPMQSLQQFLMRQERFLQVSSKRHCIRDCYLRQWTIHMCSHHISRGMDAICP